MWAVLVAAIAMFAVGALWYTALFGKQWAKLSGIVPQNPMPNMTSSYIWHFVTVLITSFILSKLISWFCNGSMTDALKLAVLIWLGFIAMANISGVLWEKKPWALYFINISGSLVTILVGTLIIAGWR
jgi:hypothetical protein